MVLLNSADLGLNLQQKKVVSSLELTQDCSKMVNPTLCPNLSDILCANHSYLKDKLNYLSSPSSTKSTDHKLY